MLWWSGYLRCLSEIFATTQAPNWYTKTDSAGFWILPHVFTDEFSSLSISGEIKTGSRTKGDSEARLGNRISGSALTDLEEEAKRALQTKQTTCDGLETGKCAGCRVKKNKQPLGSLGSCEPARRPPDTVVAPPLLGLSAGLLSAASVRWRPHQCSGEHTFFCSSSGRTKNLMFITCLTHTSS